MRQRINRAVYCTAYKRLRLTLSVAVQFEPASVVRSIAPASPTAMPVLSPVKRTAYRFLPKPLAWLIHVVPPSVVRRILPLSPTTVPLSGLVQFTPYKSSVVAVFIIFHNAPTLVVRSILPSSPTIAPTCVSLRTNCTPQRLVPAGIGCCTSLPCCASELHILKHTRTTVRMMNQFTMAPVFVSRLQ